MYIVLLITSIILLLASRYVLRWRKLALTGFGTGVQIPSNIPPILCSYGPSIWLVSQIVFFGSAVAVYFLSDLRWALILIISSFVVSRILVFLTCRSEFEGAIGLKKLFDENDPDYAENCRKTMKLSYRKHFDLANSMESSIDDNPHEFGLLGALGTRYKARVV